MRLTPTEVTVLGGTRGLEGVLVPARGFALRTVPAVPIPRRPSLDLLRLPGRLRRSVDEAERHLRETGAQVVVGFGGYAAAPGYLAARRLRLPVVIHEANARPGLANRLAARFTPYVFTAVPGTMPRAEVIGLPLRATISGLDRGAERLAGLAMFGLEADRPVLLVFGGSQGAVRMNAALRLSLIHI